MIIQLQLINIIIKSNEDLQVVRADIVKAERSAASTYKTAHCLHSRLSNTKVISHQAVHSSTSRVNSAALRAAQAHTPDVASILRRNTRLRCPILRAFCRQT